MDFQQLVSQLEHNAERIHTLVRGITDEQARWRPQDDAWSILEVINHLYDEEREDFRLRLDVILHRPDDPWHSIDPRGWVTERQYNQRDLVTSVENFLAARQESLAWLRGLPPPNWEAAYDAPWGKFTAGDAFASWVAHDLLHIRQLVELHWAYTMAAVDPHSAEYAGEW
jgi:hypothetical protein